MANSDNSPVNLGTFQAHHQTNCKVGLSSSILKIRQSPFAKHFELLTQEIMRSNKKRTKCVCYFHGKVKEERLTANWFSVIKIFKTKSFFFSNKINIKHGGFCTGSPCSPQGTPK